MTFFFNSVPLKIGASNAVFALVLVVAGMLFPLLPGPHLLKVKDGTIAVGPFSILWIDLMHLTLGYALFIYGSFHAWQATRQKNIVEDPQRRTTARLLECGYYGHVRHSMYGMFIHRLHGFPPWSSVKSVDSLWHQ